MIERETGKAISDQLSARQPDFLAESWWLKAKWYIHKYGDDARGVRDWGFGVRRTNSRTAIFLRESRTPNPEPRNTSP